VRVYNGGAAPFLVAHRACGDLRSLIEAAKTLSRKDFKKPLEEDLGDIGGLLSARCKSLH
jgi:hypothetical protein